VFSIVEGGVTLVNDTFTTLASAQAFFTNQALDLGTFVSSPSLSLSFNFDLITNTVGSDFGVDFLIGATSANAPPVTTVPGAQLVQQNVAAPISGISVVDTDAVSAAEIITVALSDTTGLLSASGVGVTGAGTTRLTLSGSLAQVNADLATLSFVDSSFGSDSISVLTSDGRGGSDSHTIAVSITPRC
jgi:hypothetical protein